jgi:hypothetical protein
MDKVSFKKKWDNYWYYYKIHTIVAVIAIIVVAYLVRQCATRVDPDVVFVVATQNPVLTSEQQTAMQDYLQKLTADVNKDGKKVVQCDFLTFNDSGTAEAEQAKLVADLSSENNVIYIMDETTVKPMLADGNQPFAKVSDILPDQSGNSDSKLPVESTKLSDQSFGKALSGLGVYVRPISTTNKKDSYVANINNQLSIMKDLAK